MKTLFVVFLLFFSYDRVLMARCPTSQNDSINITRTLEPNVTQTAWHINDHPFTSATFNNSTGGCLEHYAFDNYTIYCEVGGRFTLEVLHPVKGDVYRDLQQPNNETVIRFQEPANITVKIEREPESNISLSDESTYNLTTTIYCTKPTPVLTWFIKPVSGEHVEIKGTTSMNNTTGCDVNQTTITSEITISQQTFYLVNQNFQVFSQLSYLECENRYTSLPEGYFTNNVSDSPTTDKASSSLLTSWPVIGGAVGGGVLLIVIVIIIVVVVKRRRQTKNKNGSKEILSERPRRESPMIIDEVVDYISGDDLLPVVYATVNKDKTNKKSINGGQLTSGASVSVYEDLSKKTFGFGARPGNTNITSEGANVGKVTPYLPERPAPEERTNGVNYTNVGVNDKKSNTKSSNQPRVEAVYYSVTDSDLQFDPHH